MGLSGDSAAILNSTVSNSNYGMFRGKISMHLPPEHPIIAIRNNGFQNEGHFAEKIHYVLMFSIRRVFSQCWVFSHDIRKPTKNDLKLIKIVEMLKSPNNVNIPA